MPLLPRSTLILACCPLVACDSITGTGCLDYGTPAVHVTLSDAATGQRLIFASTEVVLRPLTGAAYLGDSLNFRATDTLTQVSAGAAAGTYDLVVRKAGYAPWSAPRLEARPSDHCGHTEGVRVSAALRRE